MKHGLIDRRDFEDWLIENCTGNMAQLVKGYIKEQPIVDAVPVVRCRDCKHCEVFKNGVNCWCNEHGRVEDVDYFCANGEREPANGYGVMAARMLE